MTVARSPDELERIGRAEELQIATKRADGTLRREVPIWVVRAAGQVYVRTWVVGWRSGVEKASLATTTP